MKADRSGIEQKWVPRIKTRLTVIDAAETIDAINLPGYDLQQLKGDRADIGSISVSGNWHITFRFIDGDAEILNLEDSH